MTNIKSVMLSCIFILSVFAVIPVAANVETPAPVARGTTASYVIASAHNYANSYTYTWPAKTVSGATQIRVHFTRLEVEATYDKIYILNAAGTTIQTFGATAATSTYSTGVWSNWVTGNTLKVKLVTDSSVTKWGFATDLIEYETGSTPPPTVTPLTNGVAKSSSISTSGGSVMFSISVPSGTTQMVTSVDCPTGADFDSYGKMGAQPTTSSYTWRGYTSNDPEVVTYANPAAGTWYIMVKSYSGTGTFSITCTLTTGTPPTGNTFKLGQLANKYALIVGISNYKSISDLSFCDEDANDWYNYLVNKMGYPSANIRILGDGSSSYAKTPYGKATEANYKACLQWLCSQSGAEIAFITSGHGSGDGSGESYLCAWDCSAGESGEDGSFYDHEISSIVGASVASKIFIFIDHCYSGGLGPEIMALGIKAKIYMTTTCTANGYGYDDSSHTNGAWTYHFLEKALISYYGSSTNTAMEDAFNYGKTGYPYTGGDVPMQFDGSP